MFICDAYCPHGTCINPQKLTALFYQGTNAYVTTSPFIQQKGTYISGLFAVLTAMLLHYSSNLDNLVATQMTLLLYFFTMLRQFFCDNIISAADVTVHLQSVLFSSRVWTLRSYRILWSRTLKRIYHFLHDIEHSVLDSYDPDTTPFSPRNWRFRSYRFI